MSAQTVIAQKPGNEIVAKADVLFLIERLVMLHGLDSSKLKTAICFGMTRGAVAVALAAVCRELPCGKASR